MGGGWCPVCPSTIPPASHHLDIPQNQLRWGGGAEGRGGLKREQEKSGRGGKGKGSDGGSRNGAKADREEEGPWNGPEEKQPGVKRSQLRAPTTGTLVQPWRLRNKIALEHKNKSCLFPHPRHFPSQELLKRVEAGSFLCAGLM